ncbi:MAG: hypothetical protein A4E23_01710 [Methanomethylovorans sp. PtaU1.Bin073]|nr:MAG: hypothetical protein A4E23_01710 [Methanomethylovorans sp. PtaU1.Bin073]
MFLCKFTKTSKVIQPAIFNIYVLDTTCTGHIPDSMHVFWTTKDSIPSSHCALIPNWLIFLNGDFLTIIEVATYYNLISEFVIEMIPLGYSDTFKPFELAL